MPVPSAPVATASAVDGLPGGLTTLMQLHTLSMDVAAHVINESRSASSVRNATLPSFAAVRRKASTMSSDPDPHPHADNHFDIHRHINPPQLLALPPPDHKRRARQAALRHARAAREQNLAHSDSSDTLSSEPSLHNLNHTAYVDSNSLSMKAPIAPIVSIHELSSGSDVDVATVTQSESSASSTTDGLAGPLRKRGRKTRMQMKRHFVLVGSTLYNYRTKRDVSPSWKLNLSSAEVGTDAAKGRIVLCLEGDRRLVLYTRTAREVEIWGTALARAADGATGFYRNDSPTCVQRFGGGNESMLQREKMRELRQGEGRYSRKNVDKEMDVVDMARVVKESGEWDSFRSFSALQMRTTWRKQEAF